MAKSLTVTQGAKPTWKITWIDEEKTLLGLIALAKKENFITLDTETVGWEKGPTAEKLCLIQVGIPSLKETYLIDALAFKDLTPLSEILSQPTPLVIAHNAHFEERQMSRYKIKLAGVRDTLEMARALRKDLPNHTLQTCCQLLLGILISKESQTSDWSKRPLSEEQIQYAALDAEITALLYLYLKKLEDQLNVDPELTIELLMKQLSETARDKFNLAREIAPQLGIFNRRIEMIEEIIKEKLKNGAPRYEGEFGLAETKQVKKTEVNVGLVRELFPDIADRAISENVDRKILQQLMKEYGYPVARMDEVVEVVGHYDRATIDPAISD